MLADDSTQTCATFIMSITAIAATCEVSLMMLMPWLAIGGMIRATTCGNDDDAYRASSAAFPARDRLHTAAG